MRTGKSDREIQPYRKVSFLVLFDQIQRGRIDAVAKAGGTRSIREYVAQMRIASAAKDFLAHHPVAGISLDFYFRFIYRRIETWPAGTGMKFCLRREERLAAAHADVRARSFGVFIFAGPWGFGAFSAGDVILLRG